MLALVASFYRQRLIKQRTLWQLDKVPLIFDWQDQQYKSVLRSSRISEYFLIINVKDAVSGAQQGHLVFCWQTDQRQYRRLSAHILACQRILPKQLKG